MAILHESTLFTLLLEWLDWRVGVVVAIAGAVEAVCLLRKVRG